MDYSNNASLQELLNPSNQSSLEVHVSNVEQQARYEAMLELVKQKGIKLGINTYLSNAREVIKSQERNLDTEPYRVCRRVNILRDYPDDKIKIYP